MANKATFLRVGLLLVATAAGAVGLVMFLGRDRVREGVRYETYFKESVQGLDVGAPVKYRGVTLGQVEEIGLVTSAYMNQMTLDAKKPEAQQVFVRWVIDPKRLGEGTNVTAAVELGLRARLASQGITGLVYVELDFVDPVRFPADKPKWQPKETVLPSMPSTITQVQDAAQALAAKLQTIDFAGIVTTAQRFLDDTDGLVKTLRAGVEQVDLPGLAGDLRGLTADLRAATTTLRTTLDSKESRSLVTASTQAAERLAAATAKLPALIAALEAGVKRADAGTADLTADLVPVLRDARAAVANLRETSEALRRYPGAVLLSSPPPRDAGGRR